jgi:hypothetical protein
MGGATQGGVLGVLHYKKINTAWTEVGQKREALLDRRRGVRVRGALATGGWALSERGGAVGSARLTIYPSSSYLGVAGG